MAVGAVASAILSNPLAMRFGPKAVVTTGLLLLALSFTGQAGIGADTALWWYEILLGVSGFGLGLVMGTTTTTTMAVVAPEQAAIGAGVNNTLRQIGAALGVAVLGSILSVWYRDELGDAVNVLPEGVRETASESLGGTLVAVRELQEAGTLPAGAREQVPGLLAAAQDAYLSAMHVSFGVAAGALALAAVVAVIWLPGRIDAPAGTDAAARPSPAETPDSAAQPAR